MFALSYRQITFGTVGATPAASGVSISGNTATLQPVNGTYAGVVTPALFNTWNAKQDALTFSHPILNTAGTVSLEYNSTNLKITANQLNTIQDISTTANVRFGNLLDPMASYTFDESGYTYTNSGQNLTVPGGTVFSGGFMSGGCTGNSYAATYLALSDFTLASTFNCNDPTQSDSNIFKLSYSGNIDTYLKICVNENRIDAVFDYLQILLVINNVSVVRWHSTLAAYNDSNWHCVAVRMGSGGLKVLIDGNADAGVFLAGNSSTVCSPSLLLNCDQVSFGNSKVSLSKTKVFNRALLDYEMGVVCELTDVHPIIDSLSNLKGIGFNGATSSSYFMNLTMQATTLNGPAKGALYWANNAGFSTVGPSIAINLSSYRCDYNGNYLVKAIQSDGVCSNGNFAGYFSNINNVGNGATDFCTAVYMSANDNGSGGTAAAAYIALGDIYFATVNNLNWNKKAFMNHDGTNLVLNTVSGQLKISAAGAWTTTTPTGAIRYCKHIADDGVTYMLKGQAA